MHVAYILCCCDKVHSHSIAVILLYSVCEYILMYMGKLWIQLNLLCNCNCILDETMNCAINILMN